ncbi:arginine--tRNA ligase [Flavobacterium sp. GT3P67]|uniref:arginine--tRNA ligase n=1 Tax=Flavobacterium sp. GT3P67 TaxID=2541722 RepID=UPI00104EE4D5|nr:arginine--tRNA ligase [Flavobacterium sp. GT3P67]TDE53861.1 arginine--tRNA ligase [Flavobacterium sp. GT3P67]
MTLPQILTPSIEKAVKVLFDVIIDKVEFQTTRKEFEGDITMVIFPLLKVVKSNPVELGNKIGNYLVENVAEVSRFNVVSGFLNIVISDDYYLDFFGGIKDDVTFGFVTPNPEDKAVMVEYSSPNTNKPLHLGHVRNNLLGYSVAEIIKASGKKVYKTQIINDRGIHICKSMLAWQKFGNGQTPESTGLKGDKLVGNYYVKFEQEFQKEYTEWQKTKEYSKEFLKDKNTSLANKLMGEDGEMPIFFDDGGLIENEMFSEEGDHKNFKSNFKDKYFNNYSKIGGEVKEMLQKWEAGDDAVITLWKTMNQWVYDGFAITYKNLGVNFDCYYYESNTYLLGKDVVQIGLDRGVFEKDPDGSVWIDLTDEGLDRKIVLRSDGTAVYMTQDIGTAIQRVKDYPDVGGMVYTVGNEQDYHFKVLFLILKKLGFDWSKNLFHLSYGMVDLPSGKMKSREGTVVDADDLMQEMTATAQKIAEDLGKLDSYSPEEKAKLYSTIGLGALKYYILKVDPKKRILFNPEESVDFAGNTGPFIQYTYARIQSIIRKANFDFSNKSKMVVLHEKEKELVKQLELFPEVIQNAAQHHSPALLANFTYDLVREYNSFYQAVPILGEEDLEKKIFRVQLSKKVADTIAASFSLLGINVPERM